ncbi:hypothetical protein GLOIN_2v1487916 [Rhizophagus irregularis DAOM 181602=DAOM 197198]|uniref:Uncharacterized protein n=3 Tax=Rhizophagus irregularis TaxID=588596 RepID=U9TXG6_RHIID|nr:hypothetical protein GLOIN_2v1487916 [Rhizophagus irregularis DAOM 181602=DAOM 197198]
MYSRSTIYHDNIDNVSGILADLFNKYMDPTILNWCRHKNIDTTSVLNPKDPNFRKFVDAVTSRDIDPKLLTLTNNIEIYQQIFHNNFPSLTTFMKFVLGTTYLLKNSNISYLKDVYPFIGITYFVYNKINTSRLLDDDKSLILRDIRNLWSIFLYKKALSHTNLNGEWDVFIKDVNVPVTTDSRQVNLTPAFNFIEPGSTRSQIPLSIYIRDSLTKALSDALII